MDRAEFTRKFLEQINFVIRSAQGATVKKIDARQSRVDSASFQKWLIDERDKVLSIPAFGPFDQVNRKHMGTPGEAAETVAQWVDLYFDGVVDWGEMWGHFLSILRGIYDYPHGIDRNLFLSTMLYRKVVEAETIAATLSDRLKAKLGDPVDPDVVLLPGFIRLFQDEAKARRALDAAIEANIIDKKSRTALGKKKIVPVIIQFWDAVSDHKFNLTNTRATKEAIVDTCQPQCEAIAEQFGVSIGKSAIYDHAGQRKGAYFTSISRILGGK